MEESSYSGHGTGTVRIAPTDDGGSRLHVDWNYTDISRTEQAHVIPNPALPMSRVISRI